jgi:hypothetical protein
MYYCCDSLTEHFIWLASFFEGLVIGCIIGHENKHHRYRNNHDYISEMEKGFETGCMDGIWLGKSL